MVFTHAGRNKIRDFLAGDSITAPSHVAWGTDNTTPDEDDTDLGSESTRIAVDTTTKAPRKITFDATMASTEGNGVTYQELGLFNDASAGTLFQRSIFNDIDKDNTIELQAKIAVRLK